MNAKRSSYLIITLGLVAVFILAIAAGCTGNGSTNTASTQAPSAPTALSTTPTNSPTVQATTAAPVTTSTPVSTGQKQTLKISGSTTILPIAQAAAEAYMATHPDADIQISGGGSGVGIQAIGAKTVDIGMTSREVTSAEMAKYPSFVITPIAQDGIAVIVNPANTIQTITSDQIKQIYLGKITKWTQITGAGVSGTNNQVVVIGRDSASGTRVYFEQSVLPANTNPIASMQELNSNGAVSQNVAQTPLAIGYVSIGFLSSNVKAVPIMGTNGVVSIPSVATVKDLTYPMSRDLYLITNGKPTGLAGDFINYILSPDGQKIVADQGYVPLS
ncbi:MAG: phosphate ABC transporter substrate-binding protein [Methanoregula sp.]|jgi:phosphate transport system substrate-binding protein|uniref:phosphate ABC transporter substrate-binding protein n=1 Tax=Methanoregula sp. TaxID=2052170 RepID=UPI003D133DF3